MTDRFYRVYFSVAPASGEPRVETLLPTLLKMGIMPVWPDRQSCWSDRKSLIDSCDYLVMLSGHVYIPRPPSGVSWQHRELNHAVIRRIPVFSGLLAENKLVGSVPDDMQARLASFRSQFEGSESMIWEERKDIPALFQQAWPGFVKAHPASGWVKAGSARATPVFEEKALEFMPLAAESLVIGEERPETATGDLDTSDWLQTQEQFSFRCHIYVGGNCQAVEQNLSLKWADICSAFLAPLSPRASEDRINRELSELLAERFSKSILASYSQAHAAADFVFSETAMRKIRLKLRRSGLVRKDTQASTRHFQVWMVTPAGKQLLARPGAVV
ncbi:hypothetical protein [Sansalvadorimonas verongulae]|uniref:hypothetical protein n=1 Tax=Sansalvadorimonas verongulae TaxID=2172824 RepID=UPI0012BD57D3|nr:hypothetical protein [Sansalvadorimonas verongulae]MTI12013.1 hypothetical protein [Sansalvadorimonas verongulae]